MVSDLWNLINYILQLVVLRLDYSLALFFIVPPQQYKLKKTQVPVVLVCVCFSVCVIEMMSLSVSVVTHAEVIPLPVKLVGACVLPSSSAKYFKRLQMSVAEIW